MALLNFIHQRIRDIIVALAFLGVMILLGFAAMWAYKEFKTSPPYIDPDRYPVRGIDISRHNGMANLDAAAASGIEFVFIKASEGASMKDENFNINHQKAGHAGLMRGAYHFFRFDRDGVVQARNLLDVIRGRELELGIAIDIEDAGNPIKVDPELIRKRLADMMEYLVLKGYRPMLYTNRAGYEKYLLNDFAGLPLWICNFSSRPFDAEWQFWQFNHHGKVDGIPTEVDLNVFVGSRADWLEYLRSSSAPLDNRSNDPETIDFSISTPSD